MKALTTSVLLLLISDFILCEMIHPNIPEITEEKLAELIKDLRESEYADLHKYLLKLVLHPEEVDLNKDRKISPKELRKGMDWILMPKSKERYNQLHKDVIDKTRAGIELFITNIKDHLSYKQFQELMSRVRLDHFVNLDRLKKNVEAYNLGMEATDDL